MANTQRREEYTDRTGAMFIPMNVEGGTWNEHFITTPKLICILGIIISFVVLLMMIGSGDNSTGKCIFFFATWLTVSVLITRFVIFEEKFYYRMYLKLKDYEITTPALFWDIASIKDTDEGAILTYSDARVAVIVKVERDTITGKQREFKEIHYDAISDFYKEVVTSKYSFVQMNIMEQAGKDPRLNELSKIVYKSDNPNICQLMELEVGHIKNITHSTLYESDYFLFYTEDVSKMDSIIGDITECLFKLLDGAFLGYQILSSKDIVDLVKELYGVNYFNSTQASLMMFDGNLTNSLRPFEVTGILWDNGENQVLNAQEKNKLRNLTSGVIKETVSAKDMSLKSTLYREDKNNKIGIDFASLSDVHGKKDKLQKENGNTENTNVINSTVVNNTAVGNTDTSNNDEDDGYIDF